MRFVSPVGWLIATPLWAMFLLAGCDKPAPEADLQPPDSVAADLASPQSPVAGHTPLPSGHPPLEGGAAPSVAGEGLPSGHPTLPEPLTADGEDATAHPPRSRKEAVVNIPESVSGKWSAVILEVEIDGEKREMKLPLGKETPLREGGQKLSAEVFLPSYISDFNTITSASNELANPAVKVSLVEEGKETANGWVFQNLPGFNSFSSDQVRIRLLSAEASAGGETTAVGENRGSKQ